MVLLWHGVFGAVVCAGVVVCVVWVSAITTSVGG